MSNLHKEEVEVSGLVRAVLDTVRPLAEQKALTLTSQIDVEKIWADSKAFKRVLTNLVSNAVKFTEKGFVKVVAGQDEKSYTVKVADSGIGLSAQEIKGLFQKYHQVHTDKPGYGLGLFISRQLVEAHGGTLEVSSVEGQGSTFTIHIPKEQA